MTIKYYDLSKVIASEKELYERAISKVLNETNFILGSELKQFEKEFSKFVGAEHCVGVSNGLDAITLALQALNLRPGANILVPSHTFIATWLAPLSLKYNLVPAESDIETLNLTVESLQSINLAQIDCVIVVHMHGSPVDLDPITNAVKAFDIPIIEDCAQAHGAKYKSRNIGNTQNVCTWSFYPGKNLGAFGDGGAITCADQETANNIRMLRNYGSMERYKHEILGGNHRLDEIQAAILRIRLEKLPKENEIRRVQAALYDNLIKRERGINLQKIFSKAESSYHHYAIMTQKRECLIAEFRKRDVGFGIHYPIPCHQQNSMKHLGFNFPNADTISNNIISLPIGPHLSMVQIEEVANIVNTVH
jgi:dTDP-4-amino-4,6-dideoxygalactose transaminase